MRNFSSVQEPRRQESLLNPPAGVWPSTVDSLQTSASMKEVQGRTFLFQSPQPSPSVEAVFFQAGIRSKSQGKSKQCG
jgi:hypothetical protein